MAMQVTWVNCKSGDWCNLQTVDLQDAHFNDMDGVYIIWHGGSAPAVVRVGQGAVRDRFSAHRQDKEILAYRLHTLYATWAKVSAIYRDGVERYLAETLNPKVGDRFPNVSPIAVNLPWN